MRNRKKIIGFITLLFLIILIYIIPLPYYIEMPGSAEDLNEHVIVNGQKDNYDGAFMLTTVGVRQATISGLISAYFNPNDEIVSKKEMMGNSSSKEYDQIQQYYMESSQNYASKVALDLLKKPYNLSFEGVYVMSISEDSDFNNKLTVGSTITEVDGEKIVSSEDLMNKIQSKKKGDTVQLTVVDSDGTHQVSGNLIELEETKKTGIGITLADHTKLESDETIKFQTDDIGGPSAGLMFTLELYSLIGEIDLRDGLEIAGTGTMDSEGNVGRIGGIDKKVVAAEKSGAEIFFAPDDDITDEMKEGNPTIKSNYEEALESVKRNKLDLKVIPVKTVEDAINYLKDRK